jgi:hypothetical protein
MLMYGSFFDNDPLIPWAEQILADGRIDKTQVRIDRLHQGMLRYYLEISGPRRLYDREALRRCESGLIRGCTPDDQRFEARLVTTFFEIHSRRATYLGEERLRALVHRARAAAERLEAATAVGVAMVAFLMFTKGTRFWEDPLLPWAKSALSAELGHDHGARAQRLVDAFLGYRKQRALADS